MSKPENIISNSENSDTTMDSETKSVSINLQPQKKILHTWLYAHRQARKGTWHLDAVDRMRFQMRIERAKVKQEPLLLLHVMYAKQTNK